MPRFQRQRLLVWQTGSVRTPWLWRAAVGFGAGGRMPRSPQGRTRVPPRAQPTLCGQAERRGFEAHSGANRYATRDRWVLLADAAHAHATCREVPALVKFATWGPGAISASG